MLCHECVPCQVCHAIPCGRCEAATRVMSQGRKSSEISWRVVLDGKRHSNRVPAVEFGTDRSPLDCHPLPTRLAWIHSRIAPKGAASDRSHFSLPLPAPMATTKSL